ncbi:MAG TPA: transporter [Syntrophales bacterium]|nr:transporter [Syntrophales bacterium]
MRRYVFVFLVLVLWTGKALAFHPLVTDDTGTQGKGRFQFELNGQISLDKQKSDDGGSVSTVKTRESELKAALTYGVSDRHDVTVGLPYQWKKTDIDDAESARFDGFSDICMEWKWRFYESGGLSFAVKPGLTLPTGDKDKDLGAGRVTGSLFLIATKEADPVIFHVNAGYKRNENKLSQREDILHASVAGEYRIAKPLRLVADVGAETNSDPGSRTWPAYILGGFIYGVSENFDLDAGVKAGLNDAEKDVSFLAGITIRF